MKKLFFIVVAAVLVVGGLASCNTEGKQYAESIAERMNQERVEQGLYGVDTVLIDGDEVVAVIDIAHGGSFKAELPDDEQFKAMAIEAMANHNTTSAEQRDSLAGLADYGYSIVYRITNHDDEVEVEFSPDEVKEIFGNK